MESNEQLQIQRHFNARIPDECEDHGEAANLKTNMEEPPSWQCVQSDKLGPEK